MHMASDNRTLYLRWVLANGFGEMLGLGATFALTALYFLYLDPGAGAGSVLLTFTVAVTTGALEATLVGLAQWWAMHPHFSAISRRAWWGATLVGALVAYVLGYLPSTLMDLSADAGQAPPSEPPQWIVLLLAAGLGLVGGAVLSCAQWLVLRRHVKKGAGWWVPANMVAWAVAMPVIFWGVDATQQGLAPIPAVALLGGTLLLAGLIVGAIHGLALVKLVQRPDRGSL